MDMTALFQACQMSALADWLLLPDERPPTTVVENDEDGHARGFNPTHSATYTRDPRLVLQWGSPRTASLTDEAQTPKWLPEAGINAVVRDVHYELALLVFAGSVVWLEPMAALTINAAAGDTQLICIPRSQGDAYRPSGWELTRWQRGFGQLLTVLSRDGAGYDVLDRSVLGGDLGLEIVPGTPLTQ